MLGRGLVTGFLDYCWIGSVLCDVCVVGQAFMLPAMKSMDNLKLETYSEVRRMTFEPKGTVRGVIIDQDGREIFLNPGGRVVLTAGTYQTARLLLASGMTSGHDYRSL